MKYIFSVITLLFFSSLQAQNVSLVWAKQMGGTLSDIGNSIAVDASGNVYTTGYFSGTVDFDPGAGTYNLTAAGSNDIFVSKLDASGNFVWAKQMGGASSGIGNSIAVDASGNVYTTGYFSGTADFDPGAGTYNLTSAGGSADIFVSKLDASGNFVWAKNMGGASNDIGNSIAVDASGNVYTTGYFQGTADFDPGAGTYNLTAAGSYDIFVSKLDASGNFVWAKNMGGASTSDIGNSMAVDASGNVYTTGYFQGTVDFDPGAGTVNLTSAGSYDIFVSKLDASGNFVWAKNMGGASDDLGISIAVDASGNVYTTGYFYGTADFDPGAGTYNLTPAGAADIFVSKLDASGNFVWAKNMGGASYDQGNSIAVDASGNVYTTGYFSGTVDFDPGAGTVNLTSAGSADIFVSKLDASGNFVWAKNMGGASYDVGNSIAVDAFGNVYTTGYFQGTADFDPGAGTVNLTSAGSADIFIVKLGTDYFRSRASGNWNDVNTWESSPVSDFSSGVVSPATVSPDFNNSNTITVLNTHTVTVTANVTVDQTTINSGGALIVNPNIVLTINDGIGTDITVSSGGSFTLKSTAAGTASVGNSAGTTSGNFTIERYIPARRAWRFLSAPVSTTGAPTINASWQEGVTTASVTPNPNPGFGTHITGGSTANGFDQNPGHNPSLKIYNNITPAIDQNNWVGISTTLTPITGQQGYMLFVRGSRANNLSQGTSAVADNTTLRMTGGLKTGDQNTSVDATGYTVVGNPYASPINLNNLAKTNGSTNVADNFYVWDPKMAGTFGVGAYVNILWNPGSSSYDITPTPTSPVSQYIQSGEAFFATSTGSAGNLIIKEADKSTAGSDNVFRVISPPSSEQRIRTNLYEVNTDGTTSIVDGTLNSYSNIFSDAVDKFDAAKLTNFGENIGIVRDGKTLIVERRDAIGDDINFKMWQMNQQGYQLEVIAENIDPNVSAFLQDKYLKSNTPLNISGTTKVNFTVTADAASAAENRFSIVFGKPVMVPSNISIYPNPVTKGTINLKFDNMPKGNYMVRVVNNLGQTVISKQINHAQGTNIETLHMNYKKGIYHVEITRPDNTKYITKIIAD